LGFVCFVDEPGKQVRSAVRLKNTSKSHVAFKVYWFLWIHVSLILFVTILRSLNTNIVAGECAVI